MTTKDGNVRPPASRALAPFEPQYAMTAMVASADHLATSAAVDIMRSGGSAADAAIAANAVLAVTLPSQCGLGGDIFAIVHEPGREPAVLTGAGRAGSGSSAERLRAEGHRRMPAFDIRSVTVPGCVDGWVMLHRRYGRLPFGQLLRAAIDYARAGFPASSFLADALAGNKAGAAERIEGAMPTDGPLRAGTVLRRPDLARTLEAVAAGGREAFYGGEFGKALLSLGSGWFVPGDLEVVQAEWTEPLQASVFGARVWIPRPPSSAYLVPTAGWIAGTFGLPSSPDDPQWAHVLVEAMRQAAFDRPSVLFDGADGDALLSASRLAPRAAGLSATRSAVLGDSYRPGGTTYLCAVDADRMAVSLMQSNCMGFGSRLTAGGTGVWLHNRGIGFSLDPASPSFLRPARRPAHTLSPVLVTDHANGLRAVLGTRGGDSQPQVVLQLLARMLAHGQDPAAALAAPRWILRGDGDDTSFATWESQGRVRVCLEANAPPAWAAGLRERGHVVEGEPAFAHSCGHAQVIELASGVLRGAADPRSGSGSAAGF
jgi:gamma-glutamyltranspeptidase / glutathione hydrolase